MKELPTESAHYKSTPVFTESTVPAGLLKRHSTKTGTWGKIVVTRGLLKYRILEPELEELLLDPETPGIVEPTIGHEVEPVGEVTFHVEFHR